MHRDLNVPIHRNRQNMPEPTLLMPENEWRKLSLLTTPDPRKPIEKEDSSVEKERAEMGVQSKAMKQSWLNTTESHVKEKGDMDREVHRRIAQDEINLEVGGAELRKNEEKRIVAKAIETIFSRREEIRCFHGALMLSDSMSCWAAQKKEKDAIHKVWAKNNQAQDDAMLLKERQNIEQDHENARKKRLENIANQDEVRKQICRSCNDFELIQRQAEYVKKHVDDMREEDRQEAVRAESRKSDMRQGHLDNLAMQKRTQEAKHKEQAYHNMVQHEYIQDKVTRVKKTADHWYSKIRARHQDPPPGLFTQTTEAAAKEVKQIEECLQRAQAEAVQVEQKKEQHQAEKREKFIQDGIDDRERAAKVRDDRTKGETEIQSNFETIYAKHRDLIEKQDEKREAKWKDTRLELEKHWAHQVRCDGFNNDKVSPKTAVVQYAAARAAHAQKVEDQYAARQTEAEKYIDKVIEERQDLGRNLEPLEHARRDLLRPPKYRKIIPPRQQRAF